VGVIGEEHRAAERARLGAVRQHRDPGQHHLCHGYKSFFHHTAAPTEEMTALLREQGALGARVFGSLGH
jgi:hypothetical protein